MTARHSSEHVATLVEMARHRKLAVLMYSKSISGKKAPEARLVEPYSFSEGKQDLLIRCYQLQKDQDAAECGWRFFMAHKIHSVERTAIEFHPRRPITMHEGATEKNFTPNPHWHQPGRLEYRDLLCDALSDGKLDAGERFDLEGVRQKYKLSTDDLRFVHASLYHRVLGAVIEDGIVGEDEIEQIRFLHRVLWELGWSIGD